MKSLKSQFLFFALLGLWAGCLGQKSMQDSCISFPYLGIVYGGHVPGGDLADRFGWGNTVGGEVGYKTRFNLYASLGARLLFGTDVREKIAENLTELMGSTETGFTPMALGNDGRWYELRLYERGLVIPFKVGYVLPGLGRNPNSGPYVELGGQYIFHKVRMEVPGNAVPGLFGENKKGYDRLSDGIGLVQGIGYRLHSNSRLINFDFGIECSQNFTQGRRDVQYDTGLPYRDKRVDMMFGLRAAWIFPIYQSAPDDEYYF